MSWFWSSSKESAADKSSLPNDVYAGLDPELRAFARADSKNEDVPIGSSTNIPQRSDRSSTIAQEDEPELKDELGEVIARSKSRKAQVNTGAMFNCALAEYELNQCFVTGSWWDKSQLCEVQKGAFWDCLEGNRKSLNILGYGEAGNTKAQDQAILEEADNLYMRQLAANDAAKRSV